MMVLSLPQVRIHVEGVKAICKIIKSSARLHNVFEDLMKLSEDERISERIESGFNVQRICLCLPKIIITERTEFDKDIHMLQEATSSSRDTTSAHPPNLQPMCKDTLVLSSQGC